MPQNPQNIVSIKQPVKDVNHVLGLLGSVDPAELVGIQDQLKWTIAIAAGTPRRELDQIFSKPLSVTGQHNVPITGTSAVIATNAPPASQNAAPFLVTSLQAKVRATQPCLSLTGQMIQSNTKTFPKGVPALGASSVYGDAAQNAVFTLGTNVQQAKMNFMDFAAARLVLAGNFEMMNQDMQDIGECSGCGPNGMGTMLMDPGPYIKAANDRLLAAGVNRQFFPQNIIPACQTCAPVVPLPPALVSAMIRNQGYEGQNNGLYVFPKNFVLCMGIAFELSLYISPQEQGAYAEWLENMQYVETQQYSSVLNGNLIGQQVVVTAALDSVFTNSPCVGGSSPFLAGHVINSELYGIGYDGNGVLQIFPKYGAAIFTTSGGPVSVPQGSQISPAFYSAVPVEAIITSLDYAVVKSGQLEIELSLCGWNLNMKAVLDWYTSHGCLSGALSDMYGNSVNALSQGASRVWADGLAGITPEQLEENRRKIAAVKGLLSA